MSNASPFAIAPATPIYPDTHLYTIATPLPRVMEFSGWKKESLSWKQGCYIHAGLSGAWHYTFSGPDALEFLQELSINSFRNFPVGTGKHAIMLDDRGLIAAHAMIERDDEQTFRWLAGGPYTVYQQSRAKMNLDVRPEEFYIFQVAGPTSIQALERAADESLRDIAFLHFRDITIAGKKVQIARVGMSGTLSYELRGPLAEGPEVYDAVFKAGQDFGIERLGWRTYFVNHVEGGFPQLVWTFTATVDDPEFAQYMAQFMGASPENLLIRSGSVDPADLRARQRTPVELDWQRFARFDHDFIGRAALEKEMADPKRTLRTLVWSEEYKTLDLPSSPQWSGFVAHADHVLKDGKSVGYSSGTTYSYYYRDVISHGTIDIGEAEIGNEVIVQWGDHGGRIKNVRARVERFPYLEMERNQTYDLTKIPSGVAARSGAEQGQ
jgi:vanillate/3-O-methylgallate O-demethylase